MNHRPLVVTGPIGSGKSTVSKLIESFGAVRADLDQLSKNVLQSPGGSQFVLERWPTAVSGNEVDRAALADLVFRDPTELRTLEGFVHPLVVSIFQKEYYGVSPLVVEVSVPFSISIEDSYLVVVDAPVDLRSKRLLSRGMSRSDIDRRISAQPSREKWLALADAILGNDADQQVLLGKVHRLWLWWTSGRR